MNKWPYYEHITRLWEDFSCWGGGGLSKNVGYYGWLMMKNLKKKKKKKNWLKHPKAVPKNEIWTKI